MKKLLLIIFLAVLTSSCKKEYYVEITYKIHYVDGPVTKTVQLDCYENTKYVLYINGNYNDIREEGITGHVIVKSLAPIEIISILKQHE